MLPKPPYNPGISPGAEVGHHPSPSGRAPVERVRPDPAAGFPRAAECFFSDSSIPPFRLQVFVLPVPSSGFVGSSLRFGPVPIRNEQAQDDRSIHTTDRPPLMSIGQHTSLTPTEYLVRLKPYSYPQCGFLVFPN